MFKPLVDGSTFPPVTTVPTPVKLVTVRYALIEKKRSPRGP
jgi:hypothetical protein